MCNDKFLHEDNGFIYYKMKYLYKFTYILYPWRIYTPYACAIHIQHTYGCVILMIYSNDFFEAVCYA